VAEVARVLLDHVQVDEAQRHRLAIVGEGGVEWRVHGGRVGEPAFLGEPRVVGRCPCRVGCLEGSFSLVGVLDQLVSEPLAKPGALNPRQVPDQAEQGQVRRRHRALGELLSGQALALVQQRRAVPVEKRLQHGALVTGQRSLEPRYLRCCPGHGTIMSCRTRLVFANRESGPRSGP
jgi:hypothetical protein